MSSLSPCRDVSAKEHFTLPVYFRLFIISIPHIFACCLGLRRFRTKLASNRVQPVDDSSLRVHDEVIPAAQVHPRIEFDRLRLDVP